MDFIRNTLRIFVADLPAVSGCYRDWRKPVHSLMRETSLTEGTAGAPENQQKEETERNTTRLQAFSRPFTDMVMPGTDIGIELAGKAFKIESVDLFFAVFTERGHPAAHHGYSSIQNPKRQVVHTITSFVPASSVGETSTSGEIVPTDSTVLLSLHHRELRTQRD